MSLTAILVSVHNIITCFPNDNFMLRPCYEDEYVLTLLDHLIVSNQLSAAKQCVHELYIKLDTKYMDWIAMVTRFSIHVYFHPEEDARRTACVLSRSDIQDPREYEWIMFCCYQFPHAVNLWASWMFHENPDTFVSIQSQFSHEQDFEKVILQSIQEQLLPITVTSCIFLEHLDPSPDEVYSSEILGRYSNDDVVLDLFAIGVHVQRKERLFSDNQLKSVIHIGDECIRRGHQKQVAERIHVELDRQCSLKKPVFPNWNKSCIFITFLYVHWYGICTTPRYDTVCLKALSCLHATAHFEEAYKRAWIAKCIFQVATKKDEDEDEMVCMRCMTAMVHNITPCLRQPTCEHTFCAKCVMNIWIQQTRTTCPCCYVSFC